MIRVIIISIIAASLLPGCGSLWGELDEKSPPREVVVEGQQPREPVAPRNRWLGTQFEDVPVPQGFTLDYDSSYVSVSSKESRVADLRYTGALPRTEVLAFVQQAMQQAGWQSASLTGVAIKTIRYYKSNEECQLVIHAGGDESETVVMVRLYPR